MALYNTLYCTDGTQGTINFNGFSPLIGEIWMATDDLTTAGIRNCYEITSLINEPSGSYSAQTEYTTCDECLRANYGVIRLSNCLSNAGYYVTYDSFIGVPIIGDVFNGTISFTGGGRPTTISSCFTIDSINQYSENQYNINLSVGKVGTITDINNVYTGCTDCLTGSTVQYSVKRCTDEIGDCVGLIGFNSELVGHLISYSNGVDLYCGQVLGVSESPCSFEYTFISDFGDSEIIRCETCLSSGNTRLLLSNCLKPEVTEVVWASALYNVGEVSSLSTDLGCFSVVGPTEDPVTINYYLNFDPIPTCQQCIECNGFTINWISCSNPAIVGSTTSYQYVSSGDFLWHPYYGCIEVTGVGQGDLGNNYVYNFETFSSCSDCLLTADRVLYEATACTSATTYVFNVSVPSTANSGETYQLSWGDIPFICVTLTEPVGEGMDTGEFFTSDFQILCEDCLTLPIGVRAINCSTGQYSVFNLTQEDYVRNHYSKEFNVFKTNGECYFIANSCPQQPTGITSTITNYYDICFECTPTDPPRSAGTESTICVICYDVLSGETATSVSPPHPVWTDSRGIAVTQLNAIALGGMNGLNN
jgi:hypothetical protein